MLCTTKESSGFFDAALVPDGLSLIAAVAAFHSKSEPKMTLPFNNRTKWAKSWRSANDLKIKTNPPFSEIDSE
jgi:hypothetical protein